MARRFVLPAAGFLLAAAVAVTWFAASRWSTEPLPGEGVATSDEGGEAPAPAGASADGVPLLASAVTRQRDSRPGAVRARVTRGPDDAPVPGVPVVVEAPGTGPGRRRGIAWTDDRGEATVENVPPGDGYLVRAQPAAHPPVDRAAVPVRPGETTDVGTIRLDAIGLVDGLVLDEVGEPIRGARVVATLDPATVYGLDADAWPLAPDPPFSFRPVETDDRGRFRLEGVPPGLVGVRVTAKDRRGATDRVLVPAQGPKSGWVVFVLRAGSGFAGRVLGENGGPVEGATVEAGTAGLDGFEARARGTTDEKGRFALVGFGAVTDADLQVTSKDGGVAWFHHAPPDRELELRVPRGATLVVTVLDEASKEPVRDALVTRPSALGGPAGADRRREEGGAPTTLHGDAVGTTGAQGLATLLVAPRAAVSLVVAVAGYRTASAMPRQQVLCTVAGDFGRLLDADERREVAVYLRRGVPLTVLAKDADDRPLGGVALRLVEEGARPSDLHVTGADGLARFAHVALERRPVVEAVGRVGGVRARASVQGEREATALSVTIYVPRGARVAGKVVRAGGGPVPGARVRAREKDPEAWTDGDGRFVLDGLDVADVRRRPVPVRLSASAAGVGTGLAEPVLLSPGSVEEGLVISLSPGGEIRGVVLDLQRSRLRHPLVELLRPGDPTVLRTVAAEEFGDYVFRAVPPGVYWVRARSRGLAGRAPAPVRVDPDPDALTPFTEVRAGPVTEIAVRVVDSTGDTPVDGVEVTLKLGGGIPSWADPALDAMTSWTGADGTARFVTAGQPSSVSARDRVLGHAEEEVRANEPVTVIRLPRRWPRGLPR